MVVHPGVEEPQPETVKPIVTVPGRASRLAPLLNRRIDLDASINVSPTAAFV